MAKLFEGARQNKKGVLTAIALGILFWLAQVLYQYAPNNIAVSIITGSAFAGATLIGLALLSGPLSRIFPKLNYVQHRRNLGVLGFTFAIVHVIAVLAYSGFNLGLLFPTLDPLVNPLVFGVIAFVIYLPLYVTSTDWATQKLGFKSWKTIHRLVYFAWLVTVAHFVLVNILALMTPPGLILMLVTGLVFAFELAAFALWSRRGKNTLIGAVIIAIGILLFYRVDSAALDSTIKYGAIFIVAVAVLLVTYKKLSGRKKNAPSTGTPQTPASPAIPVIQN